MLLPQNGYGYTVAQNVMDDAASRRQIGEYLAKIKSDLEASLPVK